MNAIDLTGAIDIDAAQAVQIIQGTEGRFFRVDFIKRTDETLRRMVARTGVKATGNGERPYDPADYNLISVWCAEKQDFRQVPIEGIQGIRSQGVAYRVT